ncbi:hypothetical protein Cgig2_029884 [Carnegiea gigantea]|uniref:Uncharacterized protein n=1 Tax=Carnegiea gigantea TaxID=171969 RepID=A0A9Q1K585_9CARY|nr:hypothetical protein Cgig2_029884 [Carnegiea gigantea]
MNPNWELKGCCNHDQRAFIITIGIFFLVILAVRLLVLLPFFFFSQYHMCLTILALNIYFYLYRAGLQVEGIEVHANEGGVTKTRGGAYWLILPAGYLGSSFWGMLLVLASTNLITARIAAGCLGVALLVVLFIAQNDPLSIFTSRVMNSLFSVYDIYDDLISRRVNSSDAEKFAEICPCPCNGVAWGFIWGVISFTFLCGAMYLGLVILS